MQECHLHGNEDSMARLAHWPSFPFHYSLLSLIMILIFFMCKYRIARPTRRRVSYWNHWKWRSSNRNLVGLLSNNPAKITQNNENLLPKNYYRKNPSQKQLYSKITLLQKTFFENSLVCTVVQQMEKGGYLPYYLITLITQKSQKVMLHSDNILWSTPIFDVFSRIFRCVLMTIFLTRQGSNIFCDFL